MSLVHFKPLPPSLFLSFFVAIHQVKIFIFRQYQWTGILKILKNFDGMQRNRKLINNLKLQKKFTRTIKIIRKIILLTIKSIEILVVLQVITFSVLNYSLIDLICLGVIGGLFHFFIQRSMAVITCISFFYFFIVCYYLNLKFTSLKQQILEIRENFKTNRKSMNTKIFMRIIREFNQICNEIIIYNSFWRKYYFAVNYTMILLNLIFLQLILFENMPTIIKIMLVISCVCAIGAHMACNSVISSINTESKNCYKSLFELYFETNRLMNTRTKIKVTKLGILFQLIYLSIK